MMKLFEQTQVAIAAGLLLCLLTVLPGNASLAESAELTKTVFLWRVNRAGPTVEFYSDSGFIQDGLGLSD